MRARTRLPIDSSCLVLQPCNPACLLLKLSCLCVAQAFRAKANASKYTDDTPPSTPTTRRGLGAEWRGVSAASAWAQRGGALGAARRLPPGLVGRGAAGRGGATGVTTRRNGAHDAARRGSWRDGAGLVARRGRARGGKHNLAKSHELSNGFVTVLRV